MNDKILNFIQSNSPDGGFLQSEYWRKFQEAWGRKTHAINITNDNGEPIVFASVIEHNLPIVGNYFYVPRGPVAEISNFQFPISKQLEKFLNELINLAEKENINWIRIEPNSEEELKLIQDNLPNGIKVKKSAVDTQPREILIMDISKNEEELLAGMKQKTRYNIKLAKKRGVKIKSIKYQIESRKYFEEFLGLVKITAKRDKITPHPESYYRKMFETIPPEILKLYIAEYDGKIIAANLVLFFGKTAAYMHGASASVHRNIMAPYLLQWQAVKDAKNSGCTMYDLGGVKIQPHPSPLLIKERENSWSGITKFKIGFAPDMRPIQFPGCYDIILKSGRYNLYRALQKIKRIF